MTVAPSTTARPPAKLDAADRALLHALTTRLPGSLALRAYQVEAVRFARAHDHRILCADEMGSGKSALALASLLCYPDRLLPALVAAPKSVVANWRLEHSKWCPGLPLHELKRGDATIPPGFRGLVLTRHGLLRDQVGMLVASGIRCAILDEAHAFKDPAAQRSQAAADLCRQIKRVIALTGSPMPNGPHELAALLSIVAPAGELPEATEQRVIRRTAADIGDMLPPLIGRDMPIDPEPDAMADYRRVAAQTRRELDVEGLDGKEVRSKLAALSHLTAAMKIPAIAELVASAADEGMPSLVFVQHRAVGGAALQAIIDSGVRAALVTGESTAKQRMDAFAAFEGGKIDVLVCTAVVREGVNLPRARLVVLLERDWVPDYERQKVGRARRATSKGPVQAIFPRVPDTIDDWKAEVMAAKDATADRVLSRLRDAFVKQTEARPDLPTWAGGGSAKLREQLPVAALLFDLSLWAQKDITLWCRVSQYTPIEVQPEDGGKRLLVRIRRKRGGVTYEPQTLRPGVVALVEKLRYTGRP
jgi:superfamily II DNA or RNA helicase